jgi:uncharacterized membrane protein YdbT with pleckstrin-like domain
MSLQDQLQPGEEILYVAHVTRLTQAPLVALLAVVLAFTAFAWFGMDNAPATVIAGIVALILGLVLAWRFFILRSNEFVLTNHRVIQQTGILAKRSMDSRLDKINNIEHRQTLWGRILGYGDVEIDTASETGLCRFNNVARPLDFKHAVLAAAEQYRGLGLAGGRPYAAPAPPSGEQRMRQLKALLDDGLISPEEYEQKRRQLLAEL